MDNTQNSASRKRILVAEDDKYFANIYRAKLNREGFDVEVVGDGAQAIDEAIKFKPDLILLDLVMPVKDGFQTLNEFRQNKDFANTKIIILSSLGQDEDAAKAKELGADDYCIKTNVTIEEMMSKIRYLLGIL